MDFSIIKKAGLRHTDFGELVGVNRLTVLNWVNGKAKPHRLLHSRVKQAIELLERGVESGALPIQKKELNQQVLRKTLATVKAEPQLQVESA